MKIDIITAFTEYFDVLSFGLIGRAVSEDNPHVEVHNLRDWSPKKYRAIDDKIAGGGAGMLMRPDIAGFAVDDLMARDADASGESVTSGKVDASGESDASAKTDAREADASEKSDASRESDASGESVTSGKVDAPGKTDASKEPDGPENTNSSHKKTILIIPTPSGKLYNQKTAEYLAKELENDTHIIFLCSRYQGVDARIAEYYDSLDNTEVLELSVGDYVVNGGEVPALLICESVIRLLPGVIGNEKSFDKESHNTDTMLLETPNYTVPRTWNDIGTPEILDSGHHANIEKWRDEQAVLRTNKMRPDLLKKIYNRIRNDIEFGNNFSNEQRKLIENLVQNADEEQCEA